jgi:hypothetical protein
VFKVTWSCDVTSCLIAFEGQANDACADLGC